MSTKINKPVRISLILLGTQLHVSTVAKLKQHKSKLFCIANISSIGDLPNTDLPGWGYSKELLRGIIKVDPNTDLTIGILEAPLEGNYYTRSPSPNVYVTTFYQAADILQAAEIDLVNYLLKTIYANVTRFYLKIDNQVFKYPSHHQTRRCIFDMTGNKGDLVYACSDMRLCEECEAELRKQRLPESYLSQLKKELKPIRINRFVNILQFIKKRPILSLFIAALSSIVLNIVSSYLYDLLKLWF